MKNTFTAWWYAVWSASMLTAMSLAPIDAADRATALEITRVRLDRKTFNPSEQTVSVSFEINQRADVKVLFYDRAGQRVRVLSRSEAGPGRTSVSWDGRRADGRLAPGNVFLYVIEATSPAAERATYNPARDTGGLAVDPLSYTLDRRTGTIEYVLPKTCMIRLRVGLEDGMLAGTLHDWEPRTAGRHVEKWDGADPSGLMNLLNRPDLNLNLTCYTLPSNTVITTGKVTPLDPNAPPPANDEAADPWARKGKYLHYQHPPAACHEPRFRVSFPAGAAADANEPPTLGGVTPVRVDLDERDARDLIRKRFEIILYVDGVFLFEMEEGSSPFTFSWDTTNVPRGPHVLTVNVMSYDDHVGVVSRRLIIGG